MTFRAQRTRTRQPKPESSWDRDSARLLALLEGTRDDAVTIVAMRERGIHTPAQMIYALQLAGYDIDRVTTPGNPGHPVGYRLRSGIPHGDGLADALVAGALDDSVNPHQLHGKT
jgi:hypothetical protein